MAYSLPASWLCFNPRLREGGDLLASEMQRVRSSFNPRLREGGDLLPRCARYTLLVSIHASAKEATKGSVIIP